ncbi:MAG: alpha-hydroxy-acid oxidizing protein [Burkholderiaceae bacterium]|nr:alpha-hydroxy-acid oxidizing protein [Burkholderiaceae bacterium]
MTQIPHTTDTTSSTPQSILEHQHLAQRRLPIETWRYLQDGDLGNNQRALSAIQLMPRPLQDVRGGHSQLSLFGHVYEHPILLAPVAYQRLFHADGESASALAASAQGGQSIISSLASQPFAQITHAAQQGAAPGSKATPWFQLYWQGDRERTLRLLQRAIDAGCSAVVFTVDAPIKVATLQLPPQISAVNLEPNDLPQSDNRLVFNGWMIHAPSWDDLAWLRQQTSLPLLLKGILHPDDAERAITTGCDGVIVSNHGGRVLPGAPASIDVLTSIVQRCQGRIPVLFDSGVRHGRDVFAALALGASAVLLGRPYLWGLANNGALGVAQVIRLLRDELEMTMALTGCQYLSDIGAHCIYAGTGRVYIPHTNMT